MVIEDEDVKKQYDEWLSTDPIEDDVISLDDVELNLPDEVIKAREYQYKLI